MRGPAVGFVLALVCAPFARAQPNEASDGGTTPEQTPADPREALEPRSAEELEEARAGEPATPGVGAEVPEPTDLVESSPRVEDTSIAAPPEAQRKVRFTGFPFVFYLPETNVGFGFGVGLSVLTRAPAEGSPYRWFPSNLTMSGAYTLNNQLRFQLTPELYLLRGRLVVDGLTELKFYPDRFYGLGRDADATFQRYRDTSFRTSTAFRYQVRRGIYVGGVLDFSNTTISRIAATDSAHDPRPAFPSQDWLGTGAVEGEHGSRVLGVGPTFVVDRRDFPLMSRRGYFVRALIVGYPRFGGLTHAFVRTLLDVRGFVPLGNENVILAGQYVFASSNGQVPFTQLSSIGGPISLRAFPEGRFRDSVVTFAQAEVRFPIVWRIRGAAGVGVGSVFGPSSQQDRFRAIWSTGFGLRVVLVPERRLAVRGDLMFGNDGLRVLAYVHEAF